jgi:DNA-binding response OmpR family regulator
MKKNKILIVEDNLVWREKYKKWLGDVYIYVDSADAINAASTFDAQIPDLVILDLGLPEIEQGLELLDNIIAKSTDVEVIVSPLQRITNTHWKLRKEVQTHIFLRAKILKMNFLFWLDAP